MLWAANQRTDAGAKLTLLALANFADDEGHTWASRETLCDWSSQSVRTVSRQLARLEADGLIARPYDQRRRKSGRFAQHAWALAIHGEPEPVDPDILSEKMASRAAARRARSSGAAGRNGSRTAGQNGARPYIDDPVRKIEPVREETRARGRAITARRHHERAETSSARGYQTDDVLARAWQVFMAVYPSRGKHPNPWAPAQAAFAKAVRNGADSKGIVDGAAGYAAAKTKSRETGTEFVCQAITFLRQARWEQYQALGRAIREQSPDRSTETSPEIQVTAECPPDAADRWRRFMEAVARDEPAKARSWLRNLIYDGERVLAPSQFIRQEVDWWLGRHIKELGFGLIDVAESEVLVGALTPHRQPVVHSQPDKHAQRPNCRHQQGRGVQAQRCDPADSGRPQRHQRSH